MESTFTLHEYTIMLPTVTTPFQLILMGDIHYDSPKCAREEFKKDVKQIAKMPNAHVLLLGDENDAGSKTERDILSHPKLHDTTLATLDHDAWERTQQFLDAIDPIKNKLIGVMQGNHYWQFRSSDKDRGIVAGATSTDLMCRELGLKNLGWLSYIRVSIRVANSTKRASFDIVACHGRGGGRLLGTSLNRVEDLRKVFPSALAYCSGHDHQRMAVPSPTLRVVADNRKGTLRVQQHEQFLCRSGSYLKAYEPEQPDYVVKALLRPASLGYVCLTGRIDRRTTDGVETMDLKFRGEV